MEHSEPGTPRELGALYEGEISVQSGQSAVGRDTAGEATTEGT